MPLHRVPCTVITVQLLTAANEYRRPNLFTKSQALSCVLPSWGGVPCLRHKQGTPVAASSRPMRTNGGRGHPAILLGASHHTAAAAGIHSPRTCMNIKFTVRLIKHRYMKTLGGNTVPRPDWVSPRADPDAVEKSLVPAENRFLGCYTD